MLQLLHATIGSQVANTIVKMEIINDFNFYEKIKQVNDIHDLNYK